MAYINGKETYFGILASGAFAPLIKLNAPTIAITEGTLVIHDDNNGTFVEGYKVYVDGVYKFTVTSKQVTLSRYYIATQTVDITVSAIAANFAESDKSNKAVWVVELAYTLSSDGKSYSVSGIGTIISTDIVVPSTYNGLPVRAIAERAFENNTKITSVTVPDGVWSVLSYAFYGCTALKSVTFEGTPTSISTTAFSGCSNLNIYVPWSEGAISGAPWGATNATIHYDGIEEPEDPEEPDEPIVPDEPIDPEEPTTQELAYTLSSDGTHYICRGIGTVTDTDIVIPSTYNGLPVKEIKHDAFYDNTSITSVLIASGGVETIGNWAFNCCSNLTSVILGNSVHTIGSRAFRQCSALASITIPNSVKSIEDNAFENCFKLKEIIIPKNVETIGVYAFYNSALTRVVFDGTPTNLDAYALSGCYNLTDVYVPWVEGEVEGAPWGATNANIHYNVGTAGLVYELSNITNSTYVVWGIGTATETDIVIPSTYNGLSISGIATTAFTNNASIKSVTILAEGIQIGNGAFQYCTNLKTVTFKAKANSIGSPTFKGCTALTDVYVPWAEGEVANAPWGVPDTATIHYNTEG